MRLRVSRPPSGGTRRSTRLRGSSTRPEEAPAAPSARCRSRRPESSSRREGHRRPSPPRSGDHGDPWASARRSPRAPTTRARARRAEAFPRPAGPRDASARRACATGPHSRRSIRADTAAPPDFSRSAPPGAGRATSRWRPSRRPSRGRCARRGGRSSSVWPRSRSPRQAARRSARDSVTRVVTSRDASSALSAWPTSPRPRFTRTGNRLAGAGEDVRRRASPFAPLGRHSPRKQRSRIAGRSLRTRIGAVSDPLFDLVGRVAVVTGGMTSSAPSSPSRSPVGGCGSPILDVETERPLAEEEAIRVDEVEARPPAESRTRGGYALQRRSFPVLDSQTGSGLGLQAARAGLSRGVTVPGPPPPRSTTNRSPGASRAGRFSARGMSTGAATEDAERPQHEPACERGRHGRPGPFLVEEPSTASTRSTGPRATQPTRRGSCGRAPARCRSRSTAPPGRRAARRRPAATGRRAGPPDGRPAVARGA